MTTSGVHMRADEARDLGRLGASVLRTTTDRVRDLHSGISQRVFGSIGPAGAPVRVVHDGVATGVYAGVRTGLQAVASLAGTAGAVASRNGRPLDASPPARVALAILNGTHGDTMARRAPALALPMTVRHAGADVSLDPPALLRAYPRAGPTVVVFLHGLTETEGAWCYRSERHHGRRDVSFGTLLERDLGCTAVFLRYPSGRHICDNGRALDVVLQRLVDAWPVPVQDLVLVGHSMGGLVARSALHLAGGGTPGARAWTRLVRDTVTLGTPHLGAPLERSVHRLSGVLRRLPETRPVADLLASRSAGIKDLRHGTLVQDDWSGHDPDAAGRGPHTSVPLLDDARHFVVLATVPRDPDSCLAHLVGDLLVPPRSACGDGADGDRLDFPADHVHRLGGLHHFDLLSHPRVYAQLRAWLAERPAPQPTRSSAVTAGRAGPRPAGRTPPRPGQRFASGRV